MEKTAVILHVDFVAAVTITAGLRCTSKIHHMATECHRIVGEVHNEKKITRWIY